MPDFVTTFTTAPELRPYSASNELLMTRNSSMRIGRRLDRGQIGEEIVAVAAVHGIVVGAPAATVDGDDARFVGAVKRSLPSCDCTPGCKLQKLINVALVQRQLRRGALIDDGAELRARRIDDRGRASDFHSFCRRAELQRDVHADDFVQVERNSLAHIFLESLLASHRFRTSRREPRSADIHRSRRCRRRATRSSLH